MHLLFNIGKSIKPIFSCIIIGKEEIKMNEDRYLKIAYFSTNIRWAYQVRQKMNEDQKKKYFGSALPDIESTISRKISTIRILINNTNLEMSKINKILREKQGEVDFCLKNCKALVFEDIHHIYRVIAYFEATLIQMVAVIDLLLKYISTFFSQILLSKKGQSKILEMLSQDGIDTEWKRELYFIRRIVTHSYTGWPSFEKMNTHFQLVINFPKSVKRMKEYKYYPYDSLGSDKINIIFENFNIFYENAIKWFLEKFIN